MTRSSERRETWFSGLLKLCRAAADVFSASPYRNQRAENLTELLSRRLSQPTIIRAGLGQ